MKELHYVTADEAVRSVRSGDHIHLSSVASVPHILIEALCRRADAGEIEDLHFHHFHTEGPAPYSEERYKGIFFDQGFFVGPNVRANVNAGHADYLPVHLGESQKLYRSLGIGHHMVPGLIFFNSVAYLAHHHEKLFIVFLCGIFLKNFHRIKVCGKKLTVCRAYDIHGINIFKDRGYRVGKVGGNTVFSAAAHVHVDNHHSAVA